jgi:hypothetical protein
MASAETIGTIKERLASFSEDPLYDTALSPNWHSAAARGVTLACSLRSHGGWLVSNCGASSGDWIQPTGSRCRRSDRESVKSGFTSLVHTECSTWRRQPRRSTFFTRSRRRRERQAGKAWRRRATGGQAGQDEEGRVKTARGIERFRALLQRPADLHERIGPFEGTGPIGIVRFVPTACHRWSVGGPRSRCHSQEVVTVSSRHRDRSASMMSPAHRIRPTTSVEPSRVHVIPRM